MDDATEVESLMSQISKPVKRFMWDGAYDRDKVREQLHKDNIRQVIPPQRNAVTDKKKRPHRPHMAQRDKAIEAIKAIGRKEWKIKEGYHHRSKAETAMFRYKIIIGDKLAARKTVYQKTEVAVGCKILNIMLQTTKPQTNKTA